MQIHTTIPALRAARLSLPAGVRIALVPTMGALHAGHLSLFAAARAQADFVIATIFVNPLQFAPGEDLARYPRTLPEDIALLEAAHVDLLFAPTPADIYPPANERGSASSATPEPATLDPGPLATRLDGASRPGHFRGVATIVAKLFNLTQPHLAFFGQKDAAQLAILRQLIRDLNFPIELISCPIVRDPDGLALSSRNRFLSPAERVEALALPRALDSVRRSIESGERGSVTLLETAQNSFASHSSAHQNQSLKSPRADAPILDYFAIVDPNTLLPIAEAIPGTLVAIAAHVGATRLVDNFLAP